jgi:hypothetical protein
MTWAAPVKFSAYYISCPNARLCVAVNGGNVLTSSDPIGGAAAWKVTKVAGAQELTGLSCPSINLCVAVDLYGNVVSSTNPTAGAAAWKVTHVDGHPCVFISAGDGPPSRPPCSLTGVSCTSSGLCVAIDVGGNVVTSKNPTGGAAAWKVTHVARFPPLSGISCPSSELCVAVGGNAEVVASTNPTGGPAAWTSTIVDTYENGLSGVSCPSTDFCAAVGFAGEVVVSTRPAGGATAWTVAFLNENALESVSCPTSIYCVAVDDGYADSTGGNVITSSNPTGGEAAWNLLDVHGSGQSLVTVYCPSTSLCIVVDDSGYMIIGTRPV